MERNQACCKVLKLRKQRTPHYLKSCWHRFFNLNINDGAEWKWNSVFGPAATLLSTYSAVATVSSRQPPVPVTSLPTASSHHHASQLVQSNYKSAPSHALEKFTISQRSQPASEGKLATYPCWEELGILDLSLVRQPLWVLEQRYIPDPWNDPVHHNTDTPKLPQEAISANQGAHQLSRLGLHFSRRHTQAGRRSAADKQMLFLLLFSLNNSIITIYKNIQILKSMSKCSLVNWTRKRDSFQAHDLKSDFFFNSLKEVWRWGK